MKRTATKITDRQIKSNLKKWYLNARGIEYVAGMAWYREAQEFTESVAYLYKIDPYKVAGVVSALSPNNRWERNKVDAIAVIKAYIAGTTPEDVKVCTYNANKVKAFNILSGSIEITAKSPKTHAFAMNVGLNSPDHITIDKWHIRACLTTPEDGVTDCTESCTLKQYQRIEALTAQVAHSYGMKGYEFQAQVWLTIKRVWNR